MFCSRSVLFCRGVLFFNGVLLDKKFNFDVCYFFKMWSFPKQHSFEVCYCFCRSVLFLKCAHILESHPHFLYGYSKINYQLNFMTLNFYRYYYILCTAPYVHMATRYCNTLHSRLRNKKFIRTRNWKRKIVGRITAQ